MASNSQQDHTRTARQTEVTKKTQDQFLRLRTIIQRKNAVGEWPQPQSQSLKESCLPSYLKCKALAVWVFRGSQFYGCLIASEIVGVRSREIGGDTFKRFFRRCLGSRKVINCNTLREKIQEKRFRKFWFSSQSYSLFSNFGIIAKQQGTAGISNSDSRSNGSRP